MPQHQEGHVDEVVALFQDGPQRDVVVAVPVDAHGKETLVAQADLFRGQRGPEPPQRGRMVLVFVKSEVAQDLLHQLRFSRPALDQALVQLQQPGRALLCRQANLDHGAAFVLQALFQARFVSPGQRRPGCEETQVGFEVLDRLLQGEGSRNRVQGFLQARQRPAFAGQGQAAIPGSEQLGPAFAAGAGQVTQ